ncbi:hypothetical protein ACFL6C_02770 [Myxococcota bacterium]
MDFDAARLDFAELAHHAVSATSARGFLKVGGGILVVSLLLGVGRQIYKMLRSEQPDFVEPIVRVVFFGFLLAFYGSVVTNIMFVVASFGSMNGAASHAELTFLQRFAVFERYLAERSGDDNFFGGFSVEGLRIGLLQVVTFLSFWFTMAAIYVVKHVQTWTLAVVINFGPIMIGFGSLGGMFNVLAVSWFWALVEVSAWGVTMSVLLETLAGVPAAMPGEVPQMGRELMVNIVYAVSVLAVPMITSWLIRSHPAGYFGQAGIGRMIATAIMVKTGAVMAGGVAMSGMGAAGKWGGSAARGLWQNVRRIARSTRKGD